MSLPTHCTHCGHPIAPDPCIGCDRRRSLPGIDQGLVWLGAGLIFVVVAAATSGSLSSVPQQGTHSGFSAIPLAMGLVIGGLGLLSLASKKPPRRG